MHTRTHAHTHAHTRTHAHTHTRTHAHTRTHTHKHTRFLHDRERPPDATANMRKLLTVHLKNLPLRRRLAAELGMTDVLQTLSSSFNEGFLNDVARL